MNLPLPILRELMKIQLSDHFTYGRLFRFVGPSTLMMVFTSLFNTIDDGFFVSNFVGKDAFVAINIMAPITMVMAAVAFMLGAGGNALVSRLLGEQKRAEANASFSSIVYFSMLASIGMALFGLLLLDPYCRLMQAEDAVYENCVQYALFAFSGAIVFVLQGVFQTFFITAERPTLAMGLTIASGVCNIVFDILLIVVLKLGISGAVLATLSGPLVTSVIPLVYFALGRNPTLRLVKARIRLAEIGRACYMGISQLISNLSMGLVSMVFNFQLMRVAGDDGVAAYGVIMYLSFVFVSVFIGYSTGVSPIVGYHFGAKNTAELRSLYQKSLRITGVLSIVLTALAFVTAVPCSMVFVSYDAALLALTVEGYRIYGLSFLFAGFGIFIGGFFTSLSDGFTAGAISFMRTIVLQIGTVLLMPLLWGLYGIWYAPVAAEALATAVAFAFAILKRPKYGY